LGISAVRWRPCPAQARLLGRDRETAIVAHALSEASSSRTSIVIVEGEAGIGKSRLLAEAGEGAVRIGLQVAAGRAEELDQGRPFGVMARVLGCDAASADPRRARIEAMLAPQEPVDRGPITVSSDPGLQFRVVDAMADLGEELTLAGPLLIAIDDLQWADPSSLFTLAGIARRPAYLPSAPTSSASPSPPASANGPARWPASSTISRS
jgi:predicted ATPase